MEVLLELIKVNGLPAGLLIYLIWNNRKDYTGVCDRLNAVEDYVKATLVGLVEKTTKTIDKNSAIIQKCKQLQSGRED
jgi:hypothetical protein